MDATKQIIAQHIAHGLTFIDVIGLLWAGGVSRLLLSTNPISIRLIVAELLMSIPGGVLIASWGKVQELSPATVLLIGCVVSLVGLDVVVKWLKKRCIQYLNRQ